MQEEFQEPGSREPIASVAERALYGFGYRFTVNRKRTSILFEARTPETGWRSRFAIYEEPRVLTVEAFVTDARYHPARRPWVMELAWRATDALPTCCFLFDADFGWVKYRSVMMFGDREATVPEIEAFMHAMAYPLRVWQEAFAHRHSKVSAKDALHASLIKLDGFEGVVTNSIRRALLKVSANTGEIRPSAESGPTLTLL